MSTLGTMQPGARVWVPAREMGAREPWLAGTIVGGARVLRVRLDNGETVLVPRQWARAHPKQTTA
jgi:hypothetical protein